MTMNYIYRKLRRHNPDSYKLFDFCITFSVLLISSFTSILYSSLIQTILPEGGDSRKQIFMIFAIALIGCTLFAAYAGGLFFRHRSRETGILLALGASRRQTARTVFSQLLKQTAVCCLIGMLLGNLLSFLIWQLLENLILRSVDMTWSLPGAGILWAICYCIFLTALLCFIAYRSLKRNNIIDIISEQRKSEPLKKSVSHRYLLSGILMTVCGILLGYVAPFVIMRLTEHLVSGFGIFYLLAVAGIYRICVYSIACHRRGRHPGAYYSRIITYNQMKFQGVQYVLNMCIIALLTGAALFAVIYTPTTTIAAQFAYAQNEYDYSFHFPSGEGIFTAQELERMAEEYDLKLTDFHEVTLLDITADMTARDLDDSGALIRVTKNYMNQFIRQSDFNNISGEDLNVADGSYFLITAESMNENTWNSYDDLNGVYLTGQTLLPLVYGGTAPYQTLVLHRGFGCNARYVISDADYEAFAQNLAPEHRITQYLFNVSDRDHADAFSRQLYREFSVRASDNMRVMTLYDAAEEAQAVKEGRDYGYAERIELKPENPEMDLDWKYQPVLSVLNGSSTFTRQAVFFLLFLYIAVICLAAVTIICYTRSITTGESARPMFEDLKRLGAETTYLRRSLKSQVLKLFTLPTLLGTLAILAFDYLIFWQNDGRISSSEVTTMWVNLGLCLLLWAIQFVTSRICLNKATAAAGLK